MLNVETDCSEFEELTLGLNCKNIFDSSLHIIYDFFIRLDSFKMIFIDFFSSGLLNSRKSISFKYLKDIFPNLILPTVKTIGIISFRLFNSILFLEIYPFSIISPIFLKLPELAVYLYFME